MSKVAIHILVSPPILEKLKAVAEREMTSVSAVAVTGPHRCRLAARAGPENQAQDPWPRLYGRANPRTTKAVSRAFISIVSLAAGQHRYELPAAANISAISIPQRKPLPHAPRPPMNCTASLQERPRNGCGGESFEKQRLPALAEHPGVR
jgi:hypothetical protein